MDPPASGRIELVASVQDAARQPVKHVLSVGSTRPRYALLVLASEPAAAGRRTNIKGPLIG